MIEIINIKEGEKFAYPLCLLRISGAFLKENKALVRNLSDANGNFKVYPVFNNAFNALVLLSEGKNEIEVSIGLEKLKRIVYYKPPDHSMSVRLVYVTCLDEENFQAPSDMKCDVNEAIKRIQIGSLLMQTFLGESLYGEGLGRRSFQLEMTKLGLPKVFHVQLPFTLKQSHSLPPEKLWEKVAILILSSPLASRSCKYLAFFSGTRFQNHRNTKVYSEKEILSMTRGHVSLGGGGLALVGTGTFYTWASNIDEILDYFNSTKKLDSLNLMDFSAMRGTYGACFGTHVGSILHEIGHTLDLGHTSEGIMSRGFEDFHLFFTTTHIINQSSTSAQKEIRTSMHSSLMKDSLTFTTDFVRKQSIENINMIVNPPKTPMSSSLLYSPDNSKSLTPNPNYRSLSDLNDPISPGFERFAPSCLSQSVKNVGFSPKSPHNSLETHSAPFLGLESDSSKLSNSAAWKSSSVSYPKNVVNCRACWTRSNAVFLAYHKWITGCEEDGAVPQLKGSVLNSPKGIRVVELRDSRMTAFHHWEFVHRTPPPLVHLPWAKVPRWPADSAVEVVAIDNEGGMLKGCFIPRPL